MNAISAVGLVINAMNAIGARNGACVTTLLMFYLAKGWQ